MRTQFEPFIFLKFLEDIQSLYEIQKSQIDETIASYTAKLSQIRKEQDTIDFKRADRSLDGRFSLSQVISKQRPSQTYACMLMLELASDISALPIDTTQAATKHRESSVVIASSSSNSVEMFSW
jgi:hypothetical protein